MGETMIYDKLMHTWNTQDIAGYFSCLHEDYQMILNSTGKTLRYVLIDCVCRQIKIYMLYFTWRL